MLTVALPFCKIELKAPKPLYPIGYPQILKTLGDHIRKKRLDLGLLQRDVAKMIDTTDLLGKEVKILIKEFETYLATIENQVITNNIKDGTNL